jgi:hypothetical protein
MNASSKFSFSPAFAGPTEQYRYPGVASYWVESEWSFVDEKGRKVSGGVSVFEHVRSVQLRDANGSACYEREYFKTGSWSVNVKAYRNNERFGALTRDTTFATLAEAQAAAVSKLAEQGKRYAKKYGAK